MTSSFIDLADDHAALRRLLCRHELASPASQLTVTPLTGGVSSSILRVTCDDEVYCIKQALPKLKVQKDWFAPVSRVFAEIEWLKLAGSLVPGQVPKILASEPEYGAFVMEYLAPSQYRNWKAELLAGHCDVEVARALGALLGTVHRGTACRRDLAATFANDDAFFALRLESYLVESARQHPALASTLERLILATQTHPYVLVHGDVSPKNVLVGPNGPVLLDAECAWYGDPAFDLAFLLNHLLLKAAHGQSPAMRKLYHAIVDSYSPLVTWEPWPVLEQRTARLLPGLLLARIDGKSPVEYLSESTRALVRDRAIRSLQAPPSSLRDLMP